MNMQCKDIPDVVFLRSIEDTPGMTEGWEPWRSEWNVLATLSSAMGAEIPARLFRAKAGKLIDRGLVDGCNCGCRGDYFLTEKGEAFLKAAESASCG